MSIISSIIGAGMIFCNSLKSWCGLSSSINTSQQAIELADRVAKYRWNSIDFDKYVIQAEYLESTNEWCVYYCLKGSDNRIDEHIFGGGGPEIHIRKSDGKITSYKLQK